MRKSFDTPTFPRVLAVAALVIATGAASLPAVSARAMDQAAVDQLREKEERGGQVREQRGRGREAARQEGRDPRTPPMFGAAPVPSQVPGAAAAQAVPRAQTEFRPEFRQRPGAGFGAPRPPDPRFVAPPRGYAYRAPPPERIVPRLPPGYRQYYWSGTPYYHFGGSWYRPYGSSFLIVGAPFGLFVPYLPAYYSTVWVGGTRYFLADDTYYVYDPARRGYVVTRSPYGNDRDDDDYRPEPAASSELFIYPMRGQGEQQQAEDRYQCHRWAVEQSHYDPTDSEYRAADRAEYDRAMTACLTGRGYSVK